MRVVKCVFVMLMLIIVLYGCAKPEGELSNATEEYNTVESGTQQAEIQDYDIKKDNNRHISESYTVAGDGNFAFKIDANVSVPGGNPKSGTMVSKIIDIALIEKYLCNGERLYESQVSSDALTYISEVNNVKNDLGYDMFFSLFNRAGIAVFSNYQLDEFYVGADFRMKNMMDLADDEKSFVLRMEDEALKLFDNLNIEAELSRTVFQTDEKNDHCYVVLKALSDGYSLIEKDQRKFLENTVSIGSEGCGGINFGGLLDINSENDVNVKNLDEILSIVKKNVENKDINTYDYIIQNIRLAYMVQIEKDKASFYPVWCFSTRITEDAGEVPCLCINAQTGAIEFMN